MSFFSVYEGEGTVYDELETNSEIKEGDFIYYLTNNQEGIRKYKVIKDILSGKLDICEIEIYECKTYFFDYR